MFWKESLKYHVNNIGMKRMGMVKNRVKSPTSTCLIGVLEEQKLEERK